MPRKFISLIILVIIMTTVGCSSTGPFSNATLLTHSGLSENENRLNKKSNDSISILGSKERLNCIDKRTSQDIAYCMLPILQQDTLGPGEYDIVRADGHPAIHGPYSLLIAADFIAPSKDKLDEAYGIDTRFLIRAVRNLFLGGSMGYARMKNEDTKGLIEGELQRYTALFWIEYRLSLGTTTWSPSVDFGVGPGWFVADPVPLSERRKDIESSGYKLGVDVISTKILRGAVQLRLPVHRSTDMSISEGNADLIVGIGVDFGEGSARYTITDYASGIKTTSRGKVVLDEFRAFVGLSFRF